jgi:SAM-dependent methyltransferase
MTHEYETDRDRFYALARTAEEAGRLHQQSLLWGEATSQVLDKLQLRPGMSGLDLGCGAGDVMLALGQRVGPAGSVLGVDTDAELGNRVAQELNKTKASRFSFLEGDVTASDFLQGRSFDVTSARFLLIHLPDPIAALRTMWRLTKPGGVMLVLDYDFGTHDTYPPCPDLEEFITVIDGVFEKAGLDPRLGFKLPYCFEQSEAGPPDGVEVSCFIKPVDELRDFMLLAYRGLLTAALELGVTTEERAAGLTAFLKDRNSADRTYWLSALYCGVWKHKTNV